MKDITRASKPGSLERNGPRWKRELLDAIDTCEASGTEVPDRHYNRYKQADILEQLTTMYATLCCYCESRIGVAEFGHIEHRKPKRKYPESTFDWENLHLACPKCNIAKGNKYDETNPILDAVVDPINEHLDYRWVGLYLKRWPATLRGTTTVNHTKLNHEDREDLLRARTIVYNAALQIAKDIKDDPDAPDADERRAALLALTKEQYGSAVRSAMLFAGILEPSDEQ